MPCEKWSLKYIHTLENVINIALIHYILFHPSVNVYDWAFLIRGLTAVPRDIAVAHIYFWTQLGCNEHSRSAVNLPPRIGCIVLFKVQHLFLYTEVYCRNKTLLRPCKIFCKQYVQHLLGCWAPHLIYTYKYTMWEGGEKQQQGGQEDTSKQKGTCLKEDVRVTGRLS